MNTIRAAGRRSYRFTGNGVLVNGQEGVNGKESGTWGRRVINIFVAGRTHTLYDGFTCILLVVWCAKCAAV